MNHAVSPAAGGGPFRVGFVVHVMQVAGAEVLVRETIRRLGAAIQPVVLCLDAIGPLGEELQRAGVPVVALSRKPGLDWATVRAMARQVREHDLDVLHAHQYTPFFYGGLGAWRAGRGTRVIFTEHGRHYPDVVSRKRRLVNRWFLARLAHRITAVCQFSARALAENDGFPASRIDVIENGIDADHYGREDRVAARLAIGLDPSRRYVACVARFHPVKDHRTLLDAFATVARDVPDADLLLAGDGPLRLPLEAQAISAGLADRVKFLGVRPDVARLLAASDVFALASLSEAASITVLEAMATGLPIVATAVGGNPEMIRSGVDGELVPRGDAAAMGAALVRILKDGTLADAMGRHGQEHVRSVYELDRTIDRYGELYRALGNIRRQGRG